MRVMLADDHRIVREGLRWMLDGEDDIEVVAEVSDGSGVLEQLARTDVDVLVLDVRMPGLGGLEALAALSGSGTAGPRVLVLSMHAEPAYVRRAIELGATGYLLKRATREQLLDALRKVAAGESVVHEELVGSLLGLVSDPTSDALPDLTSRELEVLALVANGCSNRQAAAELGIAPATVKTHLDEVFARLGVPNRTAAVAEAMRLGLLE